MSAKTTLKKKEGIKVAEKENTEEVENIEVKENQEKVLHSNEEYDELNDRYNNRNVTCNRQLRKCGKSRK